mgnify:CR=1 FL=1
MENLFFTHAGMQLSILDGVPIAVKDEIDCLPYPTTGKKTWRSKLYKGFLRIFILFFPCSFHLQVAQNG